MTAQTVVDGWSQTRDLGFRDADGYLYLVDRLRDIVVVDAHNCSTVEIEDVLTLHPAVGQAVVVGLPDARTGEAIHAAVVLRPDGEATEAELREQVRTKLGDRETPGRWSFWTRSRSPASGSRTRTRSGSW